MKSIFFCPFLFTLFLTTYFFEACNEAKTTVQAISPSAILIEEIQKKDSIISIKKSAEGYSIIFNDARGVFISQKASVISKGWNNHWHINYLDSGISIGSNDSLPSSIKVSNDGHWEINQSISSLKYKYYSEIEENAPTIIIIGMYQQKLLFYQSNCKILQFPLASKISDALILSDNYNKSVAVFGGSFASIPASKIAKNFWSRKLNLTVDTYAMGGAGFRINTTNNIQRQVDLVTKSGSKFYDIYILWASTNDIWGGNESIGAVSDYSSEDNYDESKLNTQCGGINYCIKHLRDYNPNAKICLFTSICCPYYGKLGYSTEYTDNFSFHLFVNGQIECCKHWSIPYLNQFELYPINTSNFTKYTVDGVHLNETGYRLIENTQTEFLSEI